MPYFIKYEVSIYVRIFVFCGLFIGFINIW